VGFQLSGLCERCTVQLLPARTENRFSNGSLFARGRRVNTRALHSLASALALTSKLPPRPGGSNSLSASTARQAHREHRALARLARRGHVAAHHARKLAGDGKAEPGAAEALSGRGVGHKC
jgi:hypothetical protein